MTFLHAHDVPMSASVLDNRYFPSSDNLVHVAGLFVLLQWGGLPWIIAQRPGLVVEHLFSTLCCCGELTVLGHCYGVVPAPSQG